MSRINLSAFVEGDKINTSLLITQLTKGVTTNGAPYVSLTLQDKTASIEAKLWDAKDEQLESMTAGKVIQVSGEVLKYRNVLQLRLFSVAKLSEGEYDPAEYVVSSSLSVEAMKTSIDKTLASLKDPIYRDITTQLIRMHEDKLYTSPAAAKNHHDFVGGLCTHMISMVDLAQALVKLYPVLNRDLLLVGVLLHDLGKVVELSGPILTEYTLEGKLIGHISIMQAQVLEVATSMGYQASEQVILMRHLILSHHGEYEYGSPVLPMVMEAEILNYVDNIDARMNMFDKALTPLKEGEWTQRIFALENRPFYKPKP